MSKPAFLYSIYLGEELLAHTTYVSLFLLHNVCFPRYLHQFTFVNFTDSSDGEESAWNAGDLGWIPGLGRSPGGGHGNPLPGESPWTEESGRLQSIGSQSAGRD